MSQPPDPMAQLLSLWGESATSWIKGAQASWQQVAAAFGLPPIDAPDPAGLQGLWTSLWGEYQTDLSGLPDDAFTVDFAPLAKAFAASISGTADARQQRMVRDWTDAMAVKARLGPEYYADPAQTPVRPTPRELVHQRGDVSLHRYRAQGPRTPEPLLIVYSVINRSYILDLCEGTSFVQHLLDAGLDVFMVEWGETRTGDRDTTLDWTVTDALDSCVDAIEQLTGSPRVALFGHCIGGTFAAMYAALHPERVARFLALTAPFKASDGGVVAWWTNPASFPVDQVLDEHGHMPAKLIRYTFMALKPYYELMKWRMFIQTLGDEDAMARFRVIDRWANDNVDIPAEVFRPFVTEVLQSERLLAGEAELGGRRVDLSAITCPLLNIAAKDDWIVNPDGAFALKESVRSKGYRELLLEGGHLSLILDPRQRERWTELSEFLLHGHAA